MSYLQLEIGGQRRGLKFNQMAYVLFYQHVDLAEYLATMYYAIVYAGLKANAYVKREELDVTFEQVCEWVDEMPQEDKDAALKAFTETTQWQKLIEEGKSAVEEKSPEEKKSKQRSTSKKV